MQRETKSMVPDREAVVFNSRGRSPRIEIPRNTSTLKGSNKPCDPFRVEESYCTSFPVALPPAIQFIRCADIHPSLLPSLTVGLLNLAGVILFSLHQAVERLIN